MTVAPDNIDPRTVEGFGDEWSRFDQSGLPIEELEQLFSAYFEIFPWAQLPEAAVGFDLGCGSGRWAQFVLPRVGKLHCIDPSDAIDIARRNLSKFDNVEFHRAAAHEIPLDDNSLDFGYSLGVLHHIPDTQQAMQNCVSKLKKGAPFLVYLYYRFDNRPVWFRALWNLSNIVRRVISGMPHSLRYFSSQILAVLVYWPFSRAAKLGEALGVDVNNWPLSFYKNSSFYTLRTDALDRFGTALEHRFTRSEIEQMMAASGLGDVRFSDNEPYWCAVGVKR